jgi:ATP-dependent Clp protease adaptor protein ClpS
MSNELIEKQTEKRAVSKKETTPPPKYKVIVCNDDVTPVDFVVAMLISVFKHSQDTALEITLKIHHTGSGVAGLYSYEIAEQKTIDATNLARSHGWPLIIKSEPE